MTGAPSRFTVLLGISMTRYLSLSMHQWPGTWARQQQPISTKSSCSDNRQKANKIIIIQQIRKSLRGNKDNTFYLYKFIQIPSKADWWTFKDVGFTSTLKMLIEPKEI